MRLYTLNVNALSAEGKRASESLHKGISVAFTACIIHSGTAINAIMVKNIRSKQKLGLYSRTMLLKIANRLLSRAPLFSGEINSLWLYAVYSALIVAAKRYA